MIVVHFDCIVGLFLLYKLLMMIKYRGTMGHGVINKAYMEITKHRLKKVMRISLQMSEAARSISK